jgi:hypothetical protein
LVLRLKDVSEQRLDIIHDGDKLRIEMADYRGRHGSEHARMHHAWSRTEQNARRRVEICVNCQEKPPVSSLRIQRDFVPYMIEVSFRSGIVVRPHMLVKGVTA